MVVESPEKQVSLAARASRLAFAKAIAFVCSWSLPLILVRQLSQAEFGIYKQVFLFVGSAVVVLPLGFSMTAFYFLPRERDREAQVIFNITLFNTVVGVLTCVALISRPSLLAVIFGASEVVRYAPLIGVVILLAIISSSLDLVALAHQETNLATFFIVSSQLSKTILILAAAIFFVSIPAIIYAAIIQGGLQTVALLVYLRSRWRDFWRSFDWPMLRAQLAYGLPLGAAALIYYVQGDLHNYFVANRFTPADYAIYAVGTIALPLTAILGESAGSVLIPHISYLQQQGNSREIIRLTVQAMQKLGMVYFPIFAFLLVTGREFIAFLFTTRYLPSWPVFAINLTLLPANALLYDPIVRAHAELRYFMVRMRIVLFVASLVALWVSVQRFGLVGAITTVVSISLFERMLIVFRLGRVLGVTRQDWKLLKEPGKVVIAALAGAMVAAVVRSIISQANPLTVLLVCGGCFAATYLGAMQLTYGWFKWRAREVIGRILSYANEPSK